jgi:hypothetical protein
MATTAEAARHARSDLAQTERAEENFLSPFVNLVVEGN